MENFLRAQLDRFADKAIIEANDWSLLIIALTVLSIRYFRQGWILAVLFGPQIALHGVNSVYWHILKRAHNLPYYTDLEVLAVVFSAAVLAEVWRRRERSTRSTRAVSDPDRTTVGYPAWTAAAARPRARPPSR